MTAPIVSVAASAQREVRPDRFVFVVRAEGEGTDLDAAVGDLVRRFERMEAAVAGLEPPVEIRRDRIHTWRTGESPAKWSAHRTLVVVGTELDAVPSVAEAIMSAGDVGVEGPQWQVDRDNPAHGELQAEVVHEARARAERYATALGGTLGPLVEIRDPGTATDHIRMARSAGWYTDAQSASGVGSLELGPEDVEITATVHATWQLVLPG